MARLESLGVGVGYRPPLHTQILRHRHELDFIEVISDSFFRFPDQLRALSTMITCVPHSLGLSVGSSVDPEYLERVQRVVDGCRPPWHTDHLAYTHANGRTAGHLMPVPRTKEALDVVVHNVRKVRASIQAPFALENITLPFQWPSNEMTETEFLTRVVRETGSMILLDLENVRVNAANHNQRPERFLAELPLESIAQVHLAGGTHGDGLEHDTHSAPVSEETWNLLEHLCELAPPPGVIIERDSAFPPFSDLVGEVRRARSILHGRGAS